MIFCLTVSLIVLIKLPCISFESVEKFINIFILAENSQWLCFSCWTGKESEAVFLYSMLHAFWYKFAVEQLMKLNYTRIWSSFLKYSVIIESEAVVEQLMKLNYVVSLLSFCLKYSVLFICRFSCTIAYHSQHILLSIHFLLICRSSLHGKGLNRFWSNIEGYHGPMLMLISASSGNSEGSTNSRRWIIGALTQQGFENKDMFYGNSGNLYAISPVFHSFSPSGK